MGALVLSGDTLYGTTQGGGGNFLGTVFKLRTNGSGFALLKEFSFSEGAALLGGLVLSGNTLYGTSQQGNLYGTIFKINTDGTQFSVLKSLNNADGAYPYAGLALSGEKLYGTTWSGGVANGGTVFRIRTDGTGFTTLKSFSAASPGSNTNDDGDRPQSDVLLSGHTLYGTTSDGGHSGVGVVFRLEIAPKLSIAHSNLAFVLSWPSPSDGWVLQINTSLSSTNWTLSPDVAVDDGTNITVTVSSLATSGFYRLYCP